MKVVGMASLGWMVCKCLLPIPDCRPWDRRPLWDGYIWASEWQVPPGGPTWHLCLGLSWQPLSEPCWLLQSIGRWQSAWHLTFWKCQFAACSWGVCFARWAACIYEEALLKECGSLVIAFSLLLSSIWHPVGLRSEKGGDSSSTWSFFFLQLSSLSECPCWVSLEELMRSCSISYLAG